MKMLVLLLFISSVNLVVCNVPIPDEVEFEAEVLHTDLDDFAQYFKRMKNNLDAFLYWPHGIILHIKSVQHETDLQHYLQLQGNFKAKKRPFQTFHSYGNLYYREGELFVFDESEKKMKRLPWGIDMYYEQPPITRGNDYVAIRYRSMEEVRNDIEPFYNENKRFIDTCSDKSSSLYLVSSPSEQPPQQFLEYTTGSEQKYYREADGKLKHLKGKVENNKMEIHSSWINRFQVLNQKTREVYFPDNSGYPTARVLGVRMYSVGFLAEVHGDQVKLLSEDDLNYGAEIPPTKQMITAYDFVEKVKIVEPKGSHKDEMCLRDRPEEGKFQVKGHILTKKINYTGDKTINQECPYVIKYYHSDAEFMLGTMTTDVLCTDEELLWKENHKADKNKHEVVTLFYRKPEKTQS